MLRSRGRERSLVALCAGSGKCLAKEVQCAGRGCRVAGSVLRFFLGWTQCCQCLVAMTSAAVSAVVVLCRGVCSAHTSANRCSTAQPLGVVGYISSGGCHCASPCRMDTCSQRAPNLGARPSHLPQLRQLAVSLTPAEAAGRFVSAYGLSCSGRPSAALGSLVVRSFCLLVSPPPPPIKSSSHTREPAGRTAIRNRVPCSRDSDF